MLFKYLFKILFFVICYEQCMADSMLFVVLHHSELLMQSASQFADWVRNKTVSHWQLWNVFWASRSILWSKTSRDPKSLVNLFVERFWLQLQEKSLLENKDWNIFFWVASKSPLLIFFLRKVIETNSSNRRVPVCPSTYIMRTGKTNQMCVQESVRYHYILCLKTNQKTQPSKPQKTNPKQRHPSPPSHSLPPWPGSSEAVFPPVSGSQSLSEASKNRTIHFHACTRCNRRGDFWLDICGAVSSSRCGGNHGLSAGLSFLVVASLGYSASHFCFDFPCSVPVYFLI